MSFDGAASSIWQKLRVAFGAFCTGVIVGVLACHRGKLRLEFFAQENEEKEVKTADGSSVPEHLKSANADKKSSQTGCRGTLRQVIVVCRHGARLPTKGTFKNDLSWPVSSWFWEKYQGQLTPIGCQQGMSLGAELRQHYIGSSEFPSAPGGLLDDVEPEKIGLHVVAYCSNFQRTLFMAWSILHGLLPEVPRFFCARSERVLTDQEQVVKKYYSRTSRGPTMGVPIVVQDAGPDQLLRQWESVGKAEFTEWQKENQSKAPAIQELLKDPSKGEALANKLWRITGMPSLDPENGKSLCKRLMAIKTVQTQVEIAKVHGNPIMPNEEGLELSPQDLETIEVVAKEQKRLWFHSVDSKKQSASKGTEGAGYLAHLIWWHMACVEDPHAWRASGRDKTINRPSMSRVQSPTRMDSIEELSPPPSPTLRRERSPTPRNVDRGYGLDKRFVFFSSHDTTLLALAAKLGVYVEPPCFGGYLLFELHEGGIVNCMYNKDPTVTPITALKPRKLPLCSDSMHEFDSLPEGSVSLEDMKKHCQKKDYKFAARRLSRLDSRLLSQISESNLQESPTLTPERKRRASETFRQLDPTGSGHVSVNHLFRMASTLGVEISPTDLQAIARGYGTDGGTCFDEDGFLRLMTALDHVYMEDEV